MCFNVHVAGVIYILIGDNSATFTLAQHMFLHVNCRNNNHLSNLQKKKKKKETQNIVESGRKKIKIGHMKETWPMVYIFYTLIGSGVPIT